MVDAIKDALQRASVAVYKVGAFVAVAPFLFLHCSTQLNLGATRSREHIREAGRHRVHGKSNNASGDAVLAIDLVADKAIQQVLRECPEVAGYASEEQHSFTPCNVDGSFVVVYDPLDGSQNIPVGISVGAIYGVFPGKSLNDIQNGDNLVAAGYALFSAGLTFCFCSETSPVTFEQYDFEEKWWQTYVEAHKIPRKGKTYCINEGNSAKWDQFVSTYVAQHLRGRSVRWMCCMVADVHRPLLQGGCFLYPCDKSYPRGRLRLLYEAYPLAFIWEKAGGSAFANNECDRILEVPFSMVDIHARCGIIFLGPEETKNFKRLREHLPVAFGGSETAQVERAEKKVEGTFKQELRFLRVAIFVGAIVQCTLFYKWYNSESKTET